MKLILLLNSFLIGISGMTQPVLVDDSNLPTIGTTYPGYYASLSDLGASGPDQVWDFSAVGFTFLATLDITDPTTTTYSSDFPTSNWSFVFGPYTSYFDVNTNEMNIMAFNYQGNNGGIGDYSTDNRKILEFPFSFGNSFNDTYYENSTSIDLTVTYDSYGTLIMPGGYVYTDVARVTESESTGETVTRYYTQDPLMFVGVHFTENGLFFWAQIEPSNAIDEIKNTNLLVYPNPANDFIMIKEEGQFSYEILNILGTVVDKGSNYNEAQTIDIKDLPSGTYFVKLINEFSSETHQFVID